MGLKRKAKKKSMFYTIDAILAAFILLTALTMALSAYVQEEPKSTANYFSEDIIGVLDELKISELSLEGIDRSSNNTVLEQIGEYWAANNISQAENLAYNALKDALPAQVGVAVLINDEMMYRQEKPQYKTIRSTKKLISGIQKSAPIKGFNARAYAIRMQKYNTLIVKGDVITSSVKKYPSGNNQNEVEITYVVELPLNITINDAYWFIEAAYTDNKFKAYINGDYVPGSDGSGNKLLTDVQNFLKPGENNATAVYRYGSGGAEAGDDGASHFVVNYTTNYVSTIQDFSKNYLAEVNSRTSLRYKKPVFVPGNITSISINLNVSATNVTLAYMLDGATYGISTKNVANNNVQWLNYEILDALNRDGFSYSNISSRYVWFIFELDEYHIQEDLGATRSIMKNSYIAIDATYFTDIYGHIDITRITPAETYADREIGDFYKNLNWTFDILPEELPLMLDSQLAWYYLSGTDPYQKAITNYEVIYQHPPSNFITEFARFGYTGGYGKIKNGSNTYALEFGSGYGVNPFNSLVSYTFLIPSLVPYGDTFPTEKEAVDDAILRLNSTLGKYIDAVEIVNKSISVGEVPSLWGPAIAEVRVWQ